MSTGKNKHVTGSKGKESLAVGEATGASLWAQNLVAPETTARWHLWVGFKEERDQWMWLEMESKSVVNTIQANQVWLPDPANKDRECLA